MSAEKTDGKRKVTRLCSDLLLRRTFELQHYSPVAVAFESLCNRDQAGVNSGVLSAGSLAVCALAVSA
jgi:hypothetical protein